MTNPVDKSGEKAISMSLAPVASALISLVLIISSTAQSSAETPRVGMLLKASVADHVRIDTAFRQGLRKLGYIEGKTIRIDYAAAEGQPDRLPRLAAELVRKKVDVIVTLGGAPVLAAMKATKSVPIVVGVGGDFVAAGYVKSLNRPGGNVTGLSTLAPDLMGKQMQLLKEIVPSLAKVAIIRVPGIAHDTMVRQGEAAAPQLGLGVIAVTVNDAADLADAFRRIKSESVDAIIVLRSGFLVRLRHQITARARQAGLPTMFGHVHEAQAGGLIAYGADTVALWQEAARYVDMILKGANPAELPVFQTRHFILTINLKTAKTLGITIPGSILLRADKVIE